MRGVPIKILLEASAFAFCFSVSPGFSMSPQSSSGPSINQPSDTIKVMTRLVTVNVIATDKRGRPVIGLGPENFTLIEDGKEQKISVFQWQSPLTQPAAVQGTAPPLPANVFSNAPAFPASVPHNIVVLDTWSTPWEDQASARLQIIKFVERAPVNEPLAIFELSPGGILMLQDFTLDRTLLLQAARNLRPKLRQGMRSDTAWRAVTQALRDFASSLSAYPGRKNLVWITDGFASPPQFEDGLLVWGALDLPHDQTPEARKTVNALIESQVSVYPVEAAGLRGVPFAYTAESKGNLLSNYARNVLTSRSPFPGLGDDNNDSDILHPRALRFTQNNNLDGWACSRMDELARQTGGRAYCRLNDLAGAISEDFSDGSNYYVLGYYPENKHWNGGFRKIDVRVNRTEVALRHRPGYRALSPAALSPASPTTKPAPLPMADLVRAMNLNIPAQSTLTFHATVHPPSAQTSGQVVIEYAIDPNTIAYQLGDHGLQYATVECAAAAYSENGKPVTAQGAAVDASMRPETFEAVMRSNFVCRHKLNLPTGNYRLKLAVRDGRTGGIGTVNAKVAVPDLMIQPLESR